MALPILDGNQTAATLSTIITGGAHIPAHTVVSLGSQAITDIASAVSGVSISISGTQTTTFGAVSVSNFPSSQTIAGTVTANVASDENGNRVALLAGNGDVLFGTGEGRLAVELIDQSGNSLVTAGPSLAISGTVTANGGDFASKNTDQPTSAIQVGFMSAGGDFTKVSEDGSSFPIFLNSVNPSVDVPISGTVTVGAMPNGALTTRFGSVTTANTAQITSAVTNTSRKYLLTQNISAGTVTIGIGFSPTTTQGIQLTAGGGLTFDAFCPTGAVYWLGAVTGAAFTILEG